ncbi:MAG: GIY-YIG nuclease family protein [Patescibacteria group bacterium]|nr:GIY-YIG nuclease family protein [bacterium]MDZ4240698.1 GIY-YIG nuclease family protein [Patescibacteria group bacterium]
MTSEQFKKKKLPRQPGVYMFMSGSKILYIGRATSLKERVSSYFSKDINDARGPIIVAMVKKAASIKVTPTDSVLEALLLEAHLIKTWKPPYNSREKDNKSFNYIAITKENFPRVSLVRGRQLEREESYLHIFGPFINGGLLKDAMKIVRKIFPFRDKCLPATERESGKPCFNRQIGLCPGVCSGEISRKEYGAHIRNLSLFLSGKKQNLVSSLRREMKRYAKGLEFEKAERIKKTLFSLEHIQDVALIKHAREMASGGPSDAFRIEAYDVAHISGTSVVGVMTVMENGEVKKSDYRKFKVKSARVDDTKSLKEILTRRFGHPEWPSPRLIVVDGGVAQRNMALKTLSELNMHVPVVAVVKDEHHKPKNILGNGRMVQERKREILLINSEAHRFAISYHRFLRGK